MIAPLTPAAAESAAAWLEHCRFVATAVEGASEHDALIAAEARADRFRRAIFLLRHAADLAVVAPDDLSELDA